MAKSVKVDNIVGGQYVFKFLIFNPENDIFCKYNLVKLFLGPLGWLAWGYKIVSFMRDSHLCASKVIY